MDDKKTHKDPMTQIEIIGAIMFSTGLRPADFAVKNSINTQTMYRVIKDELQTQHVREVISEAVGLSIGEIWPQKKEVA